MTTEYLGVASINGEITPLEKATLPISDRGYLFGHSVFETLLINKGTLTHWEEHYIRLLFSCQEAFLAPPNKTELLFDINKIIAENIKLSGCISEKAQLRIIISGGNSFDLGIKKVAQKLPQSNVTIICRNVTGPSMNQYEHGITVKCLPDLRSPALIDIKSCSYLYNLIALEKAKNDGFDEALFYNTENIITESTTANFIWFNDKYIIYSTPFKGSCLAGVTLQNLIQGLKKLAIPFDWNGLNRANISHVKGCGIISSIRGIVPISKIDHHSFDVLAMQSFFTKLNQALFLK